MLQVQRALRNFSFLSSAFALSLFLSLTACGGDSVKEFQEEGRKLMQEGNANGAIVFFKNALDKDSKNFELRFDLAKAYLKAGKLPQAEAELQKCLLQQPNNIELLSTAASYHTQKGNHDKAIEFITNFEQASAPTVDSRTLAATNYRVLQKKDLAEQAYKDAIKLDPQKMDTRLSLAGLYLTDGRSIEGLGLVDEILQKDPNNTKALNMQAFHALRSNDLATAESIYTKLMTLSPKDVDVAYSLGVALMRQNKIKEAEVILESMRKNFKSNAQIHMLAGMIAYEHHDYENANNYFQQSVDAQPSAEGLYRLAATLHILKNSESALSNLRRILDVAPSHGAARMLTARILLEQKRYEESELELQRFIEQFPQSAEAFHMLGTAQNAQGKKNEALASFEKALEINPKMVQSTMGRTNILLAQNDDSKAVLELEKGIKANSESVGARTALFNYYLGKQEYQKAQEVVQEGLAEIPDHPLLLTLQAGLQLTLRKSEEALVSLHKAYAIEPNFLPATQLLLNIYMMQDKAQEALALCDAYLANNPENEGFLVTSALLLDKLNRSEEATQRLEKANAMHSRRALTSLIRRALQAGDPAKAEQYLLNKLQAMPTPPVRTMLAAFYVQQKAIEKALALYDAAEIKDTAEGLLGKYRLYVTAEKYPEALQQAESIIQLQKQSSVGYILKALALEQNNNFNKAFTTLEQAYKSLQATDLLVSLGELYARDKNYTKALSYFQTALLKEPKNKSALAGQGYVYLLQKDYEKAIANYEKVIELYPNDVLVMNNLALALAEEGKNTARAVDLATKAYTDEPENAAIADTYAFTLIANKQISEALNVVQNALKANPDSSSLYYRLGQALLADSKLNEGISALQKAVDLGSFGDIEKAKKLIQENS